MYVSAFIMQVTPRSTCGSSCGRTRKMPSLTHPLYFSNLVLNLNRLTFILCLINFLLHITPGYSYVFLKEYQIYRVSLKIHFEMIIKGELLIHILSTLIKVNKRLWEFIFQQINFKIWRDGAIYCMLKKNQLESNLSFCYTGLTFFISFRNIELNKIIS